MKSLLFIGSQMDLLIYIKDYLQIPTIEFSIQGGIYLVDHRSSGHNLSFLKGGSFNK